MTGIRVGKRRGYTMVFNDLLPPDATLSARAWGIYVYLSGRPEGWTCSSRHLSSKVFKEGRDAVITALHELVDAGLMGTEHYRDGNLMRKRFVLFDQVSPGSGSQGLEMPDVTSKEVVRRDPLPPGGDRYQGYARTPLRNHLKHIPQR